MSEEALAFWITIAACCGVAMLSGLLAHWQENGAPWEPWPPFWWMRLTLWWDCWRAKHAARRLERELTRELALTLHASNAWHCGCRPCVRHRALNHGDRVRAVGVVTSTRRVFGVTVETVMLSDAEREKLK